MPMQILGIKTTPSVIRYAVVEWDGTTATLVNASTENRLRFPANYDRIEQKLKWLQDEFQGILRQYPGIERIAIKTNEYAPRRESGSSREAAYYDAIALLTAGSSALPVEHYLFASLGTNRAGAMAKAEADVHKTAVNWDENMAAAVLAAYKFRS